MGGAPVIGFDPELDPTRPDEELGVLRRFDEVENASVLEPGLPRFVLKGVEKLSPVENEVSNELADGVSSMSFDAYKFDDPDVLGPIE